MKKVLFLALNARYTHSNLALYYLYDVLKRAGIDTEIREYNINQPDLQILQEISRQNPDVLCISVYIWNSIKCKALLTDVKKILPNLKIIAGGPEVSYNPVHWLKEHDSIDHIIEGCGEEVIADLIKSDTSERIITGKTPDFSELPFPYPGLELENIRQRYFYYESSRGCPFHCAYCLSSRTDQSLIFRPLEKVFEELGWFIRNDFAHIKFVDRTFNAKPERARKIWSFLLDKYSDNPDMNIDFHFEIHPQLLQIEDFDVLKKAKKGQFRFEIGIQTLNKPSLKVIRRNMNWKLVKSNIQKLQELKNINIHLDLIAGLPLEDFSTFGENFDEVFKLKPQHLQLGFLKILPGTQMEEEAEKYGIKWQKNPPYQVLRTDVMSFEELSRIMDIENLLETFYNSQQFITFFQNIHHNSVWSFFNDFAEFCMTNDKDTSLKKWEKCAELLHEYCKSRYPDKIEYIRDCLRYDFCEKSRGHNFPEFLNHSSLVEAYKAGYNFVHNMKQIDELSPKMAKSAIYFKPVSMEFKNPQLLTIFSGLPGHKTKYEIPWRDVNPT